LKRVLIFLLFLLPATVTWLSCGGAPAGAAKTSGLKYRAFITNTVSAGTESAGVFILDAQNDERAKASPIAAGNTPGIMVVTPNLAQTLVFSGDGTQSSDNQLSFIDNATEQNSAHVTLPGMTQSIVVSPDSSTAYVAVPTAPVVGQSPGVVDAISLNTGTFTGEVNVPSVQYLSISNGGNTILGFSTGSDSVADSVAVITPSQIGLGNGISAVTYIGGPHVFDHPIAAFFSSDDSTAYILSCGAECGGAQASLQQYNLVTNTLVTSIPLCVPQPGSNPVTCATGSLAAGSVALVNGTTMYVAGTPPPLSPGVPSQPCTGQTTASNSCGLLYMVNLNTMSVTNTAPITITDGYHDVMALGYNGQLFIGAQGCTEIVPLLPVPPGAEVRGCLSIYNTLTTAVGSVPGGGILIPSETGDVTGIQPIYTRQVVYVVQGQNVQGGTLYIYDDTIDALYYNQNDSSVLGQISGLVGNFYDVVTVDP
jgi:hypothetical protein